MPIFDTLQRASFNGIEFPIKAIRISMESRHHEHIYLKAPGAATEKMSRGLYRIEMPALFDVNTRGYGQLWPQKRDALRVLAEQQTTGDLVIPTMGTIRAWMPSWHQEADYAHMRSGELIPLAFQEDSTAATLVTALSLTQSKSLDSASQKFQAAVANVPPDMKPGTALDFGSASQGVDIFEAINNAANAVFAIRDQANLFGNLLESKLLRLADILRIADRETLAFQDPVNYPAVDALHDMLVETLNLLRDSKKTRDPRVFVVPRQMSVSEISNAIYGDATHAVDIMQNNALPDPFAVLANSRLVYFPAAA